jgi:hypothetical protein
MTKHELDLGRSALTCSLCTEIVTGDHKARVTHVENHLIEIALSVMPTCGNHDAEDDVSPVNSVLSSPPASQVYGTETDVSAYESNRRRRRAERAQAKAARAEIALSVMPTGGDYDAEEDLSPVKSVLSSPHARQVYGTESDVSGYDSNRRRRRAERAQAKAARSGGSRVEFS